MNGSGRSRELSRLLTVVLTVVVVGCLYLAKTVVVPLALAVLLAFLLSPLVTLLERVHFPRALSVFAVILGAAMAVGWISWTVFRQLVEVTDHMSAYTYNINHKVEALNRTKSTSFSRAQKELQRLGREVSELHWNIVGDQERTEGRRPGASADHPIAVKEVQTNGRLDTVHGVLGALVSGFLVVVFTFFMLMQREDLRNRLIRLTGRGHLNLMTQAMDEAGHRVSRYLALQLLVNTCFGSIIFVALHFLALPHALLWGALAAILRFIPYVGVPAAALLPTAFSIAVFHGWKPTLLILALFFGVEVTTANFIEPHLYGKQTGLSPLAILVAAVFWTLIWGPIGLILSVPLTVCLVVVGGHVPRLEFLTVLLGDQPVMLPEAHYYQRLLASDEQEASQVLDAYLKDHSLEELYDQVLIPALSLSERDRHRDALDKETVNFITETTTERVEELGLRKEAPQSSHKPEQEGLNPVANSIADALHFPEAPGKPVLCVGVRDDADAIIAKMLSQLLERKGHRAQAIPPDLGDSMLTVIAQAAPDIVCLSALPPYAISHARRLYRGLRAQNPNVQIIVGIWNYAGDVGKAAKIITGEEGNQICTTLAEAVDAVLRWHRTPLLELPGEAKIPVAPVAGG